MIPKCVVFDVFGTLVQIKKGRSPYKKLMKYLKSQGRNYMPDDAINIMSVPLDFEELSKFWGYSLSDEILNELEIDLSFDLQNLVLYEDTLQTIARLTTAGFKIAVCSNLAKPYGDQVLSMLPSLDAYIWSYEAGAIKPNPKIYEVVLEKVGCEAHEVLFVGDTLLADVSGPRSQGMSARLIDRKNGQNLHDVLADLF